MEENQTPDISKCEKILQEKWKEMLENDPSTNLDRKICDAINRSINSKSRSFRYVLPTQIIAKLADHKLDSTCIQASRNKGSDFDVRSVNKKVIVKFDTSNNNVLGGSPEPYVNNPLRIPEISQANRTNQKKQRWMG